MKTMGEIFEEEEARLLAEARAEPEAVREARFARETARREAERQRHIALGWYDEDGNPGPNADPEDDEDEDEEGEDA